MANDKKALKAIDVELIERELEEMSRQPFKRVLAQIIDNAPTPDAIKALAQKNPDRHAQALAIWARLSGFTEKLEVEGTITAQLQGLSDSQLEARLEALEAELRPAPKPRKAPAASRLVPIDPLPHSNDD